MGRHRACGETNPDAVLPQLCEADVASGEFQVLIPGTLRLLAHLT